MRVINTKMDLEHSSSTKIGTARRWAIYLIGFFESFLFGGAIFGWAQLVYVLKREGLFLHLCDVTEIFGNGTIVHSDLSIAQNTTTSNLDLPDEVLLRGCETQDETFALIYTVACTVYSTPGFLIGYMLHHLGLAATRISGGTMLVLGFICLGVASRDSPYWIYPAMILIALGGNQLRMAGLQFANLFPRYRSTALSVMSGIFAASAGLFLFVQLMVQAGYSHQLACWLLAGAASTSVLLTVIMPCHHIPYEEHETHREKSTDTEDSIKPSLWSFSSISYLYWFFINLVAIMFFATLFNSWISQIAEDIKEAGFFSSLFSLAAFLTPLVSPFPGLLMDFMARRVPKDSNQLTRRVTEMRSPVIPLFLVTLLVTLLFTCLFFKHPAALYCSIVFLTLTRPSVVAVGNAFVRLRFPARHFNRLVGIYGTVVSLLTMLQYPYFVWAQDNFKAAMATMLFMLTMTLIHPLHLLYSPYLRSAGRAQLDEEKDEQAQNL